MISTKVGTHYWSEAPQKHEFHDEKVNFTSAKPEADEAKKADQNIGDLLNQVANPGGKDPNKVHRRAHNTLDKDDFLKLMLTQMKNQDPMNPMQSHEMAAQLAQFTSLEQLYNVNKNLEGLTKAQDPTQKYEILNFLGKTIKADSRQIMRQPGETTSELRFNLGGDASKVKVTITDDSGQTVKVIEYGGLKKGPNKLVWNGTDKADRDIKPGRYTFNVEAENPSGKKVFVKTESAGVITGINYTAEGPVLMVGDQKVRLQDVQKIEDEGLKEKQNQDENLKMVDAKEIDQEGDSKHHSTQIKPEDKPAPRSDVTIMPIAVAKAGSGASSGEEQMKAREAANDSGRAAANNQRRVTGGALGHR